MSLHFIQSSIQVLTSIKNMWTSNFYVDYINVLSDHILSFKILPWPAEAQPVRLLLFSSAIYNANRLSPVLAKCYVLCLGLSRFGSTRPTSLLLLFIS